MRVPHAADRGRDAEGLEVRRTDMAKADGEYALRRRQRPAAPTRPCDGRQRRGAVTEVVERVDVDQIEALIREIRPETGPLALPLTMLFFGMINWTHTWFRAEGRVSADSLADMAVDVMLGGLGRTKAS